MFRFAHPEYLFLLILIPVLVGIFIYSTLQKRKKIKQFGNPDLLAELMPNVSVVRPQLKFYFQLTAIIFLIIVLAQPQFGTKMEKEKRKGIEVMIALDVSNSMMAQDIQPNRLEKSKQVLSKLVDDMTNDKVGLVVFAGDAYSLTNLCVREFVLKPYCATVALQPKARGLQLQKYKTLHFFYCIHVHQSLFSPSDRFPDKYCEVYCCRWL